MMDKRANQPKGYGFVRYKVRCLDTDGHTSHHYDIDRCTNTLSSAMSCRRRRTRRRRTSPSTATTSTAARSRYAPVPLMCSCFL